MTANVKMTLNMDSELRPKTQRAKISSLKKMAERAARIAQRNARYRTGFMHDHIIGVGPGESVSGGTEVREGRLMEYMPVTAPEDAAILAGTASYTIYVENQFPAIVPAALVVAADLAEIIAEVRREEGL